MLDEPFAGIDPVTVQSIQGVIAQLRDNGISVLITDHAAREILGTVDRCYVIYQGQVLIDGTPEEVKQHPKVREEYLGDMDGCRLRRCQPKNYAPAERKSPVPKPHFRTEQPQAEKRARRVTDV